MPLGDFRSVFLPYCIERQPDGRYAVLNREYKPVGFFTRDHVQYDKHPVLVKFKRLTKATAAKLSWEGKGDLERVFLYNDSCIPTASAGAMRKYLDKIAILASLAVS